jgi:hypothetical protein
MFHSCRHLSAVVRRLGNSIGNGNNPCSDGRAAQRASEAIKHMFGLGDRPVPFGGSITTGA